ncbi:MULTISPECIES: acyl-CoA dehydrogenase family protein [Mycobacterium avium complex (MAC)]|jgi:alkylation response protein AidB-like acyl-CoA dehydrogenase|uniref:Acyl-CoA dehydrogenase n=1 Tax=Mycobacterium timonense TaxID=701043 RepID=A0ABX3TJD9_9MYCO|nr:MULTISPECIES: acyl-CoA dehydrogenase family protein [Mycobacterium avium complex (MAC)]ETA96289.1 acyl-CoA dehydrogenase [Mycobacterium avium 05-4293]ETB18068.1 acyl-CoA dehydrogenase [Mycobacterium avium 09-5983]ETB36683.1 acyl-CoA dehydrogenase [Mycobacterium avium subsp. hominissuis 10-5606]ETZ43916.1 acyl-CoA dehydrogenase, C-terminal domain protein [Mycobacterium avium MAV_061107_1842]MBG0727970.1 acyl-CoA/acyl-ACP dehydrogenase [Mycobacterium avium]
MDFGLTDEQDQLAAAERAWLTKNDPIARVRATLDSAAVTVDPAAVRHAAESGLLTLLTPGIGGTHVDLAVVTEEHGYAVSSLPVADLNIAAWLLDHVDSSAKDGELTGLALGPDGRLDGDALRLAGVTHPVPMAADMDSIAVAGQVGGDGEYLAVFNSPTLSVMSGMSTLDLSRSWARLDLDATIADWTRLPGGTLALLHDALAVHRAFDALGAAARLLDMTVSYARRREQFGAPIGSFQAVKHHCADMAVAVEAGRASLWAAALALDTASGAARSRAASAAAAYTKSAAAKVAGTALQVHGGIGFTWEHDLHLFLRRIKVDEAFNGSVAEHRAALVRA